MLRNLQVATFNLQQLSNY